LVHRYRGSKEEETQQIKAARRLGKALFQHIKNDPTRSYLTREDFEPFFTGLPNAEAEADAAFFFFDKVCVLGRGWGGRGLVQSPGCC
jgi:hypothetical protein